MQAADLALIRARPSRLDLQAPPMPTIETLMRLGMRDRFAFVLNQRPAGRSAQQSCSRAASARRRNLAESSFTPTRRSPRCSVGLGQGVTEYAPEGKAADELRALWVWADRKMKRTKA